MFDKEVLVKVLPPIGIVTTLLSVAWCLYLSLSVVKGQGLWFFAIFAGLIGIVGFIGGLVGSVNGARFDQKLSKFLVRVGATNTSVTDAQVAGTKIYVKLRAFFMSIYAPILCASICSIFVDRGLGSQFGVYGVVGIALFIVGALLAIPFFFYDYQMLKTLWPSLQFWQYVAFFMPVN